MKHSLRILSLALALSTPFAHAGVLLEPFVGYQVGKTQQTGQNDHKFKTTNYGARVGYKKMGLMVGGEYLTGQGTEDSGSPAAKLTTTNIGAFVGYEFPILLRVYGVYAFDAKFDRKVGTSTTNYAGGNSIKLGVGLTTLPFIAINLEYIKATYAKADGNDLTNDLTAGTYGLSVSLPFSL